MQGNTAAPVPPIPERCAGSKFAGFWANYERRNFPAVVLERPGPERIISVVPASGWWAIYHYPQATRGSWWTRDPVACWALTDDGAVVALVPGEGHALAPPDERFSHLEHESNLGRCRCRDVPLPSDHDDVWWCPSCPGVIEPAE